MRILVVLLILLPTWALGQGAATLVADTVTLTAEDQLVASGNVEVYYEGTRLTARSITYDQSSDRLIIGGPIVIQTADGTLLTANQADLDPQLQNGMLQGARLVLDQQLQVVANQIDRQDGRYSQLYKTAATSCQICGDRAPLWDIRAQRVVHDQTARQLYFDNAIFRIRGVPIFWLPRMRLPDPTLQRSNGFLIPKQRNNSQLGTGIKIPYFVTLGDHRDVTVTPYLSSQTRTLELIYRQAFTNGTFQAEGAVSDDTLELENRSYLFAQGAFRFANNYQLNFDIEAVSDQSYLSDYGYSGKDRLDSAVSLLRVTDDSLTQANLTYYQTLRDDETNATLPPIVAELGYETRLRPEFGGTLRLGAGIDLAYRYSDDDGDRGRDVTRAGLRSDWRRDWVLDGGFVFGLQSGLRADFYKVQDDLAFSRNDLRVVPNVAATLTWPWATTTASGTSHIIEPTLQVVSADALGGTPPNEDSTRNEFDQGNLFSISRFSGDDAVATGTQLAAGLTWRSYQAEGSATTLTFGKVIRAQGDPEFSPSSGLDGDVSDWLIAGQFLTPDGFVFDARALIDDQNEITRAASLIAWRNDALSLSAAYIWQAKDAQEDRQDTLSEWTLDAGLQLNRAWSVTVDARYDVAADRPVRAGLGVEWRNECVTIDVSASRRYSSSSIVEPTTTFGLSGALNGFSAGRSTGGPAARCTN